MATRAESLMDRAKYHNDDPCEDYPEYEEDQGTGIMDLNVQAAVEEPLPGPSRIVREVEVEDEFPGPSRIVREVSLVEDNEVAIPPGALEGPISPPGNRPMAAASRNLPPPDIYYDSDETLEFFINPEDANM